MPELSPRLLALVVSAAVSSASAGGAMNSLIVEVLEDHVRFHILDPDERPGTSRTRATQELFEAMQSYLR
jgi:DNA-binding FrmR family transcriptional regulator